jgi:hypothetical protein
MSRRLHARHLATRRTIGKVMVRLLLRSPSPSESTSAQADEVDLAKHDARHNPWPADFRRGRGPPRSLSDRFSYGADGRRQGVPEVVPSTERDVRSEDRAWFATRGTTLLEHDSAADSDHRLLGAASYFSFTKSKTKIAHTPTVSGN